MSDKDITILKYETLRDKLNTRENSTLVVATVASAASLVALTFNLPGFRLFSLVFALLGICYREFTIISSDMWDYNKLDTLRKALCIEKDTMSLIEKIARSIRAGIIRILLFLPVILVFHPLILCSLTTCPYPLTLLLSIFLIGPHIYEELLIYQRFKDP